MDILFLLKKDFADTARDTSKKYYCPDCAMLEGVLSYYPELRQKLDIRYIDYPRPRKEITALAGETHQGCPNLILDPANHQDKNASSFIRYRNILHSDDNKVILEYLADKYHIADAHF
jgi:hypothetical protein